MEDVFKAEGTLFELRGNRPLLIDDARSVWLVQSGNVDLFAVRLENGEPAGPRAHVFRVESGQLLFGIDMEGREREKGLLAVGTPGSQVLRLDMHRFQEAASGPSREEKAVQWTQNWIAGLCAGIGKGSPPKECVELEVGKETSLEENVNARPERGVLWVKHLEGSSRFMGMEGSPPLEADGFIPLSSQSWLQTTSPGKLYALDTASYMRKDPGCSLGLAAFHRLVLDCLNIRMDEREQEERERLLRKRKTDAAVMENALQRFIAVMEGRSVQMISSEGDPLLAACRIVGQESGIQFAPPPREASGFRNPLDAVARASRVRTRQVALRDDWWRHNNGALLAYLEADKSPMALLPGSSGSYDLINPATKERSRVSAATAQTLAPFAYTFYRPFPERALNGWEIFKFGFRGCSGDMVMILTMGVLAALLGLLSPMAMGVIFDTIIPEAARSQLVQIAIILTSCAFATSVFEITKGVALLRIESRMDSSVQSALIDRLLSLPAPFFRDYSSGDLADRAMGISTMRQMLSGVTVQALLGSIFSLVNFGLLFWYSWELALVAVALSLIGLLFATCTGYLQVRYQKRVTGSEGKIGGIILQFITGIAKLRVSGTEDRAFSVWAEEFSEQQKLSFKAGTVENYLRAFNAVFPVLALMVIFGWVIWRLQGTLTTGDFVAFNSAYGNFQNALIQMSMALMAIMSVVPLYQRAKPIMSTAPEVDLTKASPGELKGHIEVNHVNFRYDPDGPQILKDVSLQIKPGEFIALVGGSGSGKSTLFRLLLGFETPESGGVYYDEQDFAGLDVREVRRQIGVVLQNGRVMGGDIFKNIVGSSNLTLDDAWEAARMAGLEEDIKQMPMGMHTVLSVGGGTLSGGQRQRLLIARAIVHKPRILFFDEATSALDNRTQDIVSKSLERLQATRIVIAHRLSTIINADRIFVLDKGQIVECGTYEELIRQEGLFAELASRQIA